METTKNWSLDSFAVFADGTRSITQTLEVAGMTVTVDRPMFHLGDGLAVGPKLEADGMGIRIRLDLWAPMNLRATHVQVLPLVLPSPQDAIVVHQAFAADPGIGWDSTAADIDLWVLNFANGGPR